jgi:hypothetical protein
MRSSTLLPAVFLLLASAHFAPPPARNGPVAGKPQPAQSCAMPLRGAAAAAARRAAARGDHRLLAYWQNGFAATLVIPGVRICDAGASRGGPRAQDFRTIAISVDKASLGCCDRPWRPDSCGVRQEDYAAAYNLEMIRVARRRLKCRSLEADPARR